MRSARPDRRLCTVVRGAVRSVGGGASRGVAGADPAGRKVSCWSVLSREHCHIDFQQG